jgi:sn-glycerol 3-phosphate transport system substrate-binding protein
MKKLSVLLALVMLFSLIAGCAAPTPVPPTAAPQAATKAPEPTKAPAAPAATTAPAAPAAPAATAAPAGTAVPTKAAATVTNTPLPTISSAGKLKITYWRSLSGAPGDAQEDLVRKFNLSQDKIYVDSQFQGTYPELQKKLMAAIAAKAVPEVVMLDISMDDYFAKNGQFMALDDFIKGPDGINRADIIPGLLADGIFNGKVYAMPLARSTPLLYFNADMFKEVGLPDRGPKTWDEFKQFCEKLVKKDAAGKTTRVGYTVQMGATTAHWYFQSLLFSYGVPISDDKYNVKMDTPEAIAAATYFQNLVKSGIANAGTGPDGAQGEFTNQRSGMHFGSTGSLVNIVATSKFKVGVGFMPEAKVRATPTGGSGLSIMTGLSKEKQDAAWKFIKFMSNAENNVYFATKTGYMPFSTTAVNNPEMKAFMEKNPQFKVAVDQLQYAQPVASIMVVPEFTEIMRVMVEELVVGMVDPATALKKAQTALVKAYNESFK